MGGESRNQGLLGSGPDLQQLLLGSDRTMLGAARDVLLEVEGGPGPQLRARQKVSEETRTAHPAVPWREMTGMRDRFVHDYFGVSLDIVWDVVQNHLPLLREKIRQALPEG